MSTEPSIPAVGRKTQRVLHLNAGNMYGGIETYLVTLARLRNLAPAMEPHFGLCFQGRLSRELSDAGVDVHILGPVRFSRPWTLWRARRRLREIIRRIQPSSIVIHGCWSMAALGSTVRRAGIRLVFFAHNNVGRSTWVDRFASRVVPDGVISNSSFTDVSIARLFPAAPRAICRYPVETKSPIAGDAASIRKNFGTPQDVVVILQASRMESWKGQHVLLQALGGLKDLPGWECWIAGGPQNSTEKAYSDQLTSLVEKLRLQDRVRLLGQRTDVRDLMAAANLFCQPNVGPEPFGIVFIEALYAGLPVVTSNFGGGAEVVTPECGVLLPPNDADALATALRELLDNPERRARLSAQTGPRAEELCDPKRQLHRHQALFLTGSSTSK